MTSTDAVITCLDKERLRALQRNYVPASPKVDSWIDLLDRDPLSIHHDAVKKRACLYIKRIFDHSQALLTLCALSISWSRLGAIKDRDDISKILTWWDTADRPTKFPNLPGMPVKRVRSFDTHRRNESPEPSEPLTRNVDAQLEAPMAATLLRELLAHYPHWNSACGENFRKIKLTPLREASKDLELLQLWCGKLPELDTESCSDHVEIGAMLIEKIMELKNLTVIRGQSYAESKKRRRLAATALSQMNVQEVFDEGTICKVQNVSLPDIEALQPKGDGYAYVLEPGKGLLLNVTPKGTFTDIHIDSGNDGRAIVFGDCVKIWLCWPPTDHNMELWAANLGSPNQLASYGYKLEGGIIVRTCNDTLSDGNTITLPGGPIHAVFTLRGGPLGGINYGTQYNLASMAKMVALQLLREADEGITDDMKWYKSTLHETIKKAHPSTLHVALASLVPLIKVIEDYPYQHDYARFAAVIKLIDSELQELAKKKKRNSKWRCDCGKNLDLTMPGVMKHFQ